MESIKSIITKYANLAKIIRYDETLSYLNIIQILW